jgi:hypothetical protein
MVICWPSVTAHRVLGASIAILAGPETDLSHTMELSQVPVGRSSQSMTMSPVPGEQPAGNAAVSGWRQKRAIMASAGDA